ncbi:MAG: divergent PAP2 family protein, partial [Clostridia bacterium]|nr:divergent PAP2 family protein [Clostridia bacterium]
NTIDLKELIGHTPLEVLGGVILGVLVGTVLPIIPV